MTISTRCDWTWQTKDWRHQAAGNYLAVPRLVRGHRWNHRITNWDVKDIGYNPRLIFCRLRNGTGDFRTVLNMFYRNMLFIKMNQQRNHFCCPIFAYISVSSIFFFRLHFSCCIFHVLTCVWVSFPLCIHIVVLN